MPREIRPELKLIILATAVLGMVGYIYLTPPLSQSSLAVRFHWDTGLSSDLEMYLQRFALTFVLFGVFPFAAARACGYGFRELGFRMPVNRRGLLLLAAAAAVGAAVGFSGVSSPSLSMYYPYYGGLARAVQRNGAWPFLAHAAAYFGFYYIPWELLFRGVLLVPLLDVPIDRAEARGRTLFLASIQVIPSALLHFGHPALETVGAVFLGFVAGWLTVKTRSLLPILFFHAAAGIFLDLALVLNI